MRSSKKILLVFSVVIALVVIVTVAANLIIQSSSVQEQFRKKAEEIVGMPVTIGKVSFSPFTGLHLQSLSIIDPSHHRSAKALSLDFMPEWWSLLHRYWGRSLNAVENQSSQSTAAATGFVVPVLAPSSTSCTLSCSAPSAPCPSSAAATVKTGSATWHGTLRIKTVVLNDDFLLQNLKASLRKTTSTFSVDPFTAEVAGGKLAGSFLLQQNQNLSSNSTEVPKSCVMPVLTPSSTSCTLSCSAPSIPCSSSASANFKKGSAPLSPYQLSAHFSGISLSKVTVKEGVNALAGAVQGTFYMKGTLDNPEKKEGTGTLEVTGMELKPGGFLAQIGQLLQIQELQILKLHEATAAYDIAPHQLIVKSLRLHSDNLMIKARGAVSYEGMLHLNAVLFINPKIQSRLQGLLPISLLIPSEEVGYVALPFNITGSLQHPQSNLLQGVPIPAVNNNVQGLIQQILKF